MQVQLEVTHDSSNIKKILLHKDTLIGRSTGCNLRIASNGISREHCKILVSDEGVFIRDLGSSNGTFVNGKKIPASQSVRLSPGCKLTVGTVDFVVRFKAPKNQPAEPGSTVDLPPATATVASAALETSAAISADAANAAAASENAPTGRPDPDGAPSAAGDEDTVELTAAEETAAGATAIDEPLFDAGDVEPDDATVSFNVSDRLPGAGKRDEPAQEEFDSDSIGTGTGLVEPGGSDEEEFAEAADDDRETDDAEVAEGPAEKPGKLKSLFGFLKRGTKEKPAVGEQPSEAVKDAPVEEAVEDADDADDDPAAEAVEEDEAAVEADQEKDEFAGFSIEVDADDDAAEEDLSDFLNQFGKE